MILNTLLNTIKNTINSTKLPATNIPPILLVLGGKFRPGMSAKLIASNIISRQSEAGAPFGPNTDGSANIAEAMEVIRIEEIINALKYDSNIQVVIPPGEIKIIGGTNPDIVNGYGIIQ